MRRVGMAALALIASSFGLSHQGAAADTRTISFHHVHTDEDLTITYKRNGQYDEEALKKINWIMRDWRKNEAIKMDPQEIDLLGEIYQEVGGKEAIHIICGYRSPGTNSMLRRRSKGVAQFSQHTVGKAIDFYIPGVPLDKLRATAMKLQGGGVGYYPTSGSPFVHVDVGSVRAWPRMTRDQLAKLFPDGRTVHLPADGNPLPGYQLALADLERGHRTAPTPTKQRSLLAGLFGVAMDAEESDDTAAARQNAASRRAAASKSEAKPEAKPVRVAEAKPEPKSETKSESKSEPKPALTRVAALAESKPAPAPEVVSVPLPPNRPIYQIASAESRPVLAPPPRRPAGSVEVAALSATDVINSRGLWDGGDPPRPPLDVPNANIDDARRDLAVGLTNANSRETTASAGPFTRPDRVPPDIALAYAVQAGASPEARPAPPARPSSVAAVITRKPGGTVAVKPAVGRSANLFDDPWMRGLALVTRVQDTMVVTRFGDPDYTRLIEFMQKPRSAVLMTFTQDPYLGMTDKTFSGNAVVFQATITFGDQRTAALQ
jgi:uncharacterized protein YcbK (DUF882 family)